MDGTVKHYFRNGNERDCDSITDRHGNVTTLAYTEPAIMPDGSSRNLLTSVTDPSNRTLTFHWQNLGNNALPAWRIVQVDAPIDAGTGLPIYKLMYDYYTDANSPNADNELYNLKTVHLDPDGLNRTTAYTYTGVMGNRGSESSLPAFSCGAVFHIARGGISPLSPA